MFKKFVRRNYVKPVVRNCQMIDCLSKGSHEYYRNVRTGTVMCHSCKVTWEVLHGGDKFVIVER